MSIYATLTKLDREELDHIARKYPHIRADYLEFLATYGWGEVGDGNFMIYGGPVKASEIYSNKCEVGDDILLFGDDFSGYCVGVDIKSGELVELDGFGKVTPIELSFTGYLDSRLGFLNS